MFDNFWLVLLFPLLGTLINGLLGKRLPEKIVGAIGCTSVLLSFLVSLQGFLRLLGTPEAERSFTVHLFRWIEAGKFHADFALLVDPLSLLMMLIVTGVGFLIHVYSVEYMAGEGGYYRYFSYLNLFILMMSILVLANNYLLMFVGWEGVGLCSYLLIGYYLERKSAGDAAKKAFIVNRIGDVGFALGIFLIFSSLGTVEFLQVFPRVGDLSSGVITTITLLLFVGATGKSAQIPLYVWLPDAMEGPTPVSALIHAATMVTAGVYMCARSAALYSRAPTTLLVVAVIGLLTALLAALIATSQNDIKKVLAYSTISQLGYMFLAVGVGAFGAGIFHLMTHAFFKALLFLGSGSVILALHHQQDMRHMGGLRRYLPLTWISMLAATLAISGVPGLSGFFSKDEILWKSFSNPGGSLAFWLVGVLVAGLTAFYMFRLIFLTFHGEERIRMGGHDTAEHDSGEEAEQGTAAPREPSLLVTGPLLTLALLSVVGGLVGLPAWTGFGNWLEHFLEPSFEYQLVVPPEQHSHSEEILLMVITIAVAAAGIAAAWRFYSSRPELPRRLSERFPLVHFLFERKFFVDEIYELLVINPLRRLSSGFLWQRMDAGWIDGGVNAIASMCRGAGGILRLLQSGHARSYAACILGGVSLLVIYYFLAA